MARVLITGMTGARNRGCEALVRVTVEAIRQAFDGRSAEIELQTDDPTFDRDAFEDLAVTVRRPPGNSMQWLASNPIMRRPVGRVLRFAARTRALQHRRLAPLRSLVEADLIVVTGGDVLTSDYGDFPRHAGVLSVGAPVALLGHTIGPFADPDKSIWLQSTNNIVVCTARESVTHDYITNLTPGVNTHAVADLAFLLESAPAERAREILEVEHHFPLGDDPLMAISVSAGILTFSARMSATRYIESLVGFVDARNKEGWRVVFIPHVQAVARKHDDLYACFTVLRALRHPERNLVLSKPLQACEYKAVIGECQFLLGARTHATVAALSQGIPAAAIAYSIKSHAIFSDYYGINDAAIRVIDGNAISVGALESAFDRAMQVGATGDTAREMRRKAMLNFSHLADCVKSIGLA